MEAFIDPKTLARIRDMPLIAQTVAEGFLHGIQSSRQRGIGIEFNQYRGYEPGDELSRIDWKLFARSDRYYVREAERESEIEVWFLLDTSNSMLLKSKQLNSPEETWNKLDYAKHLVASLSYLAQKQGDSVGFLELGGKDLSFLEAGTGDKYWRKLLQCLASSKGGQYFPKIDLLKYHLERLQKNAMIFVISDFYEQHSEITDFISHLNRARSEVIAMQAICDDERQFDYAGVIRFQDLETGEEVLISAKQAKKDYLANYDDYQLALQQRLKQRNISHHTFSIDEPLDKMLFEYLNHRARAKGT